MRLGTNIRQPLPPSNLDHQPSYLVPECSPLFWPCFRSTILLYIVKHFLCLSTHTQRMHTYIHIQDGGADLWMRGWGSVMNDAVYRSSNSCMICLMMYYRDWSCYSEDIEILVNPVCKCAFVSCWCRVRQVPSWPVRMFLVAVQRLQRWPEGWRIARVVNTRTRSIFLFVFSLKMIEKFEKNGHKGHGFCI